MIATDAILVVEALSSRHTPRSMKPADAAMVRYVRTLTVTPGAVSVDDVMSLREHGFTDRSIYDVASITGFFAYVNRVALGLGIPLEPNWQDMRAGIPAAKGAREESRG